MEDQLELYQKEKLHCFVNFQQEIRNFFTSRNFLEIIVPVAVQNPGIEPHLHPFQLYSVNDNKLHPFYLHTSPEFKMKEFLSYDFEKIFTMSYSFRDEPSSSLHNFQFLMLEWYHQNIQYTQLMHNTFDLCKHLESKFMSASNLSFCKKSIKELFKEILKVDLENLITKNELFKFIISDHKDISYGIDQSTSWEDLFFLIFLNKIEPSFKSYPFLITYDYPSQLAALSELHQNNNYCKRFELYMSGIEIANAFQELRDLKVQKLRAQKDLKQKEELYNYNLPQPTELYDSLARGFNETSGIAVGVERLFSKFFTKFYPAFS